MKRPTSKIAILKNHMRSVLSVILVFVNLGFAASLHAATFSVTQSDDTLSDGICDTNCTLRDAIDAANSSAGTDTINIPSGTFTITGSSGDNLNSSGDYDVSETIVINGAGAGATFIDGGGIDRIFHLQAAAMGSSIERVTLQNGAATDGGCLYSQGITNLSDVAVSACAAVAKGGGVYTQGGIFTNVDFTDNTTTADGGAIYNTLKPLAINGTNNIFSGNYTDIGIGDVGGAIFSSADLSVSNSTFRGQAGAALDASSAGAIYVSTGATLTVVNSTFDSFQVGSTGGAVRMFGGTLTDVTFSNNKSYLNGGAIFNQTNPLIIDGASNFTGNETDVGGPRRGGSIYSDADLTISGANFSQNVSLTGGAIYVNSPGILTVTDSVFEENTVTATGSAISMSGGTISDVTFTNNSSGLSGGAVINQTNSLTISGNTIFVGNSAGSDGVGRGGGVYSTGDLTVSGAEFHQGAATSGGAIHVNSPGTLTVTDSVFEENTVAGAGGAVTMSGGTISDSSFSNNSSGLGGGAVVNQTNSLTISGNTIFVGNSAGSAGVGRGGGVYSTGALTVSGAEFHQGTATSGGAIHVNSPGTLTVTDSVFAENTVTGAGGAVTMSGGTISDSSFSNNSSGLGGGAVVNQTNPLTIAGNTMFVGNSAGNTGVGRGGGVYSTGNLTVSGAEFRQGTGSLGGAIYVLAPAVLSVDETLFDLNTAGLGGAAFFSDGTFTSSTFSNNSGTRGGAITSSGVAHTTNTTFSGNSASFSGGAIYQTANTHTIINSTLYENSAPIGDAVHNLGILTLENSIVAQSTISSSLCVGATSNDYNLQYNGTCFTASANDISSDPQLKVLADYGGAMPTHDLQVSSPAIDTANNSTCTAPPVNSLDQTGAIRPFRGNSALVCDMGAVEYGSHPVYTQTSAWIDSGSAGSRIWSMNWIEDLPGGTDIQVQLRTAPDSAGAPGTATNWIGPDGTSSTYWNSSNTNSGGCFTSDKVYCTYMPSSLKDGIDDQWIQYQVKQHASDSATPSYESLNILYNDAIPPGITLNKSSGLATSEDLTSDSFTVVLDSAPLGTVAVALSATPSNEVSFSPSNILTFDGGNWSNPKTVNVIGADDDVNDGDVAYTIYVTTNSAVDSDYDKVEAAVVTGINSDNDTAGLNVNITPPLVTSESGGKDSFTVSLSSEPTTDVNLYVSSSNHSEGIVKTFSPLVFTSDNWNTEQTITLTGLPDHLDDGDVSYGVILTTVSGDADYHNIQTDYQAINTDDDTNGVTITPSSGLSTSEAGGTATFDVVLNTAIDAEVTLNFSSDNLNEGDVSPSSVTFVGNTWNIPKTITVTGVDDYIYDPDQPYNIIVTVDSADPDYSALAIPNITVTNMDNDGPGSSDNFSQTAWGTATPENSGSCASTNGAWDGQSCNATHSLNQVGWSSYASVGDDIGFANNSLDLKLVEGVRELIHTTDSDFDPLLSLDITHTTDADFSNGALLSDTQVINGSVELNGALTGTLTSAAINVGSHSGFTKLSADIVRPGGTSLTIELEAADDSGFTTNSTGWLTFHDGESIADLGNRPYIRYRLNFDAASLGLTATIQAITIHYDNQPLTTGSGYPVAANVNAYRDRLAITEISRVVGWTDSGIDANATPSSNHIMFDIDGDGDMDFMESFESTANYLKAYENVDGTTWVARSDWNLYTPLNPGYKHMSAGDIDADGDMDILIKNRLFLNDGLDKFSDTWTWTRVAEWDPPHIGVLADLDADGDADFIGVWNGSYGGRGYINQTAGGKGEPPAWVDHDAWDISTPSYITSPSFVDIDSDGDLDFHDVNNYRVIENIGTIYEPQWAAGEKTGAELTQWIPIEGRWTTADMNGDGVVDAYQGGLSTVERDISYWMGSTVVTYDSATSTYTSAVLDFGSHSGFTNLSYSTIEQNGSSLSVDIRAGDDPANPDGWASQWQTIANTGSLSAFGTHRYLQYRITLNAGAGNNTTPLLNDISIGYNAVATSATLISTAFNTESNSNVIEALHWSQTLPANSDLQIQLRTAPDNSGNPGTWTAWVGPDGRENSYWNSANTYGGGCSDTGGVISCSNMPAIIRDGSSSQWLQYKVTLSGDGGVPPILHDIKIDYAVADATNIDISPTSLTTDESGTQQSFDVTLTGSAPTDSVTIDIAVGDPSEGRLSTQQVAFAVGETGPKTVQVYGVDDSSDDGNIAYTIHTSAAASNDSTYNRHVGANITVNNTDDETGGAAISVSPTSGLAVSEDGLTQATFDVQAVTAPSANVTIAVATSDASEATVFPATVTLLSGGTTPVTVTVTGVQEEIFDQDITYDIILSPASSSDTNYDGIDPADVSVTTLDDDSADLIITGGPFATTETGGATQAFIQLTARPSAEVTFDLSSSDGTEGSIFPYSMTFTPENWDISQWVMIYGKNENLQDGDVDYSVTTSAFVSADPDFNGLDPQDIAVTNMDDDSPSVTATLTNHLETSEDGGQATYKIVLGTKPANDVIVTLTSSDPTEGTVPSTLVFNANDNSWYGKVVTVTGVDDGINDSDQSYTITSTYASDDANYSSGTIADVTVINRSTDTSTFEANSTAAHAGQSVAFADVNGDQNPDLIVGVPGYNSNTGSVFIYYGTGGSYSSTPSLALPGANSGDFFGFDVANAGDVNNDGYEDIIVGAYGYNANQGAAYVYAGSATGLNPVAEITLTGSAAGDMFGYSVDGNGHFNNDNYADIVVGAYGYNSGSGGADVYFGASNINSISLSWSDIGDTVGENFGYSVAVAGNIDNNHYDELLIGAPSYSNGQTGEGRVYTYHTDASGLEANATWTKESDFAGAGFGTSIANIGDINQDGFVDIAVGAPGYDNGQSGEGWVFIYHGSDTGFAASADASLEGNQVGAAFGKSIGAAGDINLDGYDDLIVGADSFDNLGSDDGRVFLYQGSADSIVATPLLPRDPGQAGSAFGSSVAGNVDINADGYPDYAVGAPLYDNPDDGEGRVFLYRTAPDVKGIRTINSSDLQTTEAGEVAHFDVALTAPPTADVVVTLSSDNPQEGVPDQSLLLFTPVNWQTAQAVAVTGQDDSVNDGAVFYNINAVATSDDADYDGLVGPHVPVVNMDNESTVTVVTSDANLSEAGANGGEFTFFRTGDTSAPLDIYFTVGGSAGNGTDYSPLPSTVTIPAGQGSVTLPVNVVDDPIADSSETVTITLDAHSSYLQGSASSATMTIIDDDAAGITVSPTSGLTTNEAGGSAGFSIVLNTQPTDSVTIALSSDTPSEGALIASSVTFTAGNWDTPQTVTVVGQDDAVIDGDTAYTIITGAASSPTDLSYDGLDANDVAVTNMDNDVLPNIAIAATTASVDENSGNSGLLSVTRTGSTAADLVVNYTVGGSATNATDYYALGATVVIPAGSSSVDIPIVAKDDNNAEADETVTVTLTGTANYIVTQSNAATVVIRDDDQPVLPIVNFSLDQSVGEGSTVTVTAYLNKEATTYPVTVPYTISGTAANPADHNAADDSIIISSGRSAAISFDVVDDGFGDADETVIFTMGSPTNAQAGARNSHRVTIVEDNKPPRVTLASQQGGRTTTLIVPTSGNVTVTAAVSDPNVTDSHSYDWSLSNNNLVDIPDADPATFVFDPSALVDGFYKIRLSVTDDGTPALPPTEVDLLLEVNSNPPVLSSLKDSDKDGVPDSNESTSDTDMDGIADYMDINSLASNELQMDVNQQGYVLRTEAGLTLRLGDTAVAAGGDGAIVTVDDIANYGGGEGDSGAASAQDTVANNGGYFDFEIIGLPDAGQSVKIVIPLLNAIPNGAVYRKYDPDLGWSDFVVDANNQVASAPGAQGECPLPGDSSFINGMNEGYYCVQLTIEDGGSNDMDGTANHVIEDPAQVGAVQSSIDSNANTSTPHSGGGGGIVSIWVLVGGCLAYLFPFLLAGPLRRLPCRRN